MSKPTTKDELIAEIEKEHTALQKLLATYSPEQMIEDGIVGAWSPKDVLAHLIEWQDMVRGWYALGEQGETPALPAVGYKWSELPALNQAIYEKHHNRELDDIVQTFAVSHEQILEWVKSLDEEVLFTRGHFLWANNNALAAYINSSTAAHYRWARTEIRKGFKRKG